MNILDKICQLKRKEINLLKKKFKPLQQKIQTRGFFKCLLSKDDNNFNLIAEIKKSSPSKGLICNKFDPIQIAIDYERAGAKCLSVLTEKNYFGGNINYISQIKKSVNIPILRKDFIIDEYQIYESKVYQADVILLIVSILSDDELKKFLKIANELNLDCIIETHDENEIKRALKLDYPILGINNRNLKNLKTDLNNSVSLFTSISKDYTVIAESGIKTAEDINMYNDLGIFNFLIGESILRSKDYATFIKKLLNNG